MREPHEWHGPLNQFDQRSFQLRNILEQEGWQTPATCPDAWETFLLTAHEHVFAVFLAGQPLDVLRSRNIPAKKQIDILVAAIQLGYRLSQMHEKLSLLRDYVQQMKKLSFEDQVDLLCEAVFHFHHGKMSRWPWVDPDYLTDWH